MRATAAVDGNGQAGCDEGRQTTAPVSSGERGSTASALGEADPPPASSGEAAATSSCFGGGNGGWRRSGCDDFGKGHGGGRFAAALRDMSVWVMNVVTINSPDTLPVIYERGLFGIYHDWCESFGTYPRSYDLPHADHLFSKLKTRSCDGKGCNRTHTCPDHWLEYRVMDFGSVLSA